MALICKEMSQIANSVDNHDYPNNIAHLHLHNNIYKYVKINVHNCNWEPDGPDLKKASLHQRKDGLI